MKCLHCINIRPGYPQHAAVGFIRCTFDADGRFNSMDTERECAKFAPAALDVIAKRDAWHAKPKAAPATKPTPKAQAETKIAGLYAALEKKAA